VNHADAAYTLIGLGWTFTGGSAGLGFFALWLTAVGALSTGLAGSLHRTRLRRRSLLPLSDFHGRVGLFGWAGAFFCGLRVKADCAD
jgi:hypothetical protein